MTLVRLSWVQGGYMRTDSRHTGWVDSSTRSYLPKLFSETLSAGFSACTLDCFIRKHFPVANWTASESGFSACWAAGRDKELSGVTGNFCPEDPETRIAEGAESVWPHWTSVGAVTGRGLASVHWAACYSWMSLSSFQVGHRLFFCGFFSSFFFFFFVTPPPPLLFSVPSCFPVTDHSFSLPCAGAPYSVASKVHQERSLTCYLLGRDGNGWIVRVLQCLLVWWSGYEEEALSFFVLLILKTLVIGHSGSGCYYFCCCLYCNAAKVIFSKRGGSC